MVSKINSHYLIIPDDKREDCSGTEQCVYNMRCTFKSKILVYTAYLSSSSLAWDGSRDVYIAGLWKMINVEECTMNDGNVV